MTAIILVALFVVLAVILVLGVVPLLQDVADNPRLPHGYTLPADWKERLKHKR